MPILKSKLVMTVKKQARAKDTVAIVFDFTVKPWNNG